MTEVLHANIFFFITSVAVILFTLIVCLILYHILKIVKVIRRIVERVEEGTEVLAEDIDHLRSSLNPTKLIQFVMSMMPGAAPKRRRKKSNEDEE